jgi:carboxymethylenebutenolidase
MKRIALLLLLFPCMLQAQQKSCCSSISSTEKFAQLSNDENFVASHLAPLPFHFQSTNGRMIQIKDEKDVISNAYEVRASKPSVKWLIVFHEWWGLNDYIKQVSEKLANDLQETNILALDLYGGQIAKTPEEAQALMQKLNDEQCRNIIKSAFKYIGSDSHIATLGWCMGGGWSLQASIMAESKSYACVMYYGMPETDVTKLKKLNADVLGIFALQDDWITPEVVKKFEVNMKKLGKKLTVENYDAPHAFANPSNPKYVPEIADKAYQHAIDFISEKLK